MRQGCQTKLTGKELAREVLSCAGMTATCHSKFTVPDGRSGMAVFSTISQPQRLLAEIGGDTVAQMASRTP